jgi:allantoin racemase
MSTGQRPVRLWYQSMAPLDGFGTYAERLRSRLAGLLSPGVEVAIHGAARGSYLGRAPAEILRFPYAQHLIQNQVLELCLQAEREGCDGIVFGTFGEPLLRVARSAVDIPIASMPEACLLVGCSLARRMALITLSSENVRRVQEIVDRHGLGGRVATILPLEPALTEWELSQAFAQPGPVLRSFRAAAGRAVADGADLIIPAEGVFNEVLAAQGIRGIDGAAVMDCVAVACAYAEMLVALRRRTGLDVGRRWDHARPDAATITALRRQFRQDEPGEDKP